MTHTTSGPPVLYMEITWILPNLVIANIFFQSLDNSLYKGSTVTKLSAVPELPMEYCMCPLKIELVKLCAVCRLFVEKLPLHPEYAKAPPVDKANNKKVSYFSSVNTGSTC